VDYFDIHYYPQNDGIDDGTSPANNAMRLRSVRSLYDPAYQDGITSYLFLFLFYFAIF